MRLSDKITPELLRIKGELEKLQKLRIKVGIQGDADSEILTIARVHEYGAVIHAKQAKNLCIPISEESYDKSPRDFPDLFFIRSKNGYLLGVTAQKPRKRRKKGEDGPSDDLPSPSLSGPSSVLAMMPTGIGCRRCAWMPFRTLSEGKKMPGPPRNG